MLTVNGMGRRRKSNEAAGVEAIGGVVGLGVFLWFFSPGFRQFLPIILLALLIVLLGFVAICFLLRAIRPELSLSSIKTKALENYQGGTARYRPPTMGNEMQSAQVAAEATISEKLRKIDWFQFEKLVELIYQRRGFSVQRLGGANPDGGVDLIVASTTGKFIVQCKHWRKWTVGVRHIREFLGALTDHGISRGIFVTLAGYSDDARQLADKHGIQILNESDVVKMLEESGLIYSKEVSALLSDERKFCPKCESEMVLRTARVKGNQFWGCSQYPHCKFTLNLEG